MTTTPAVWKAEFTVNAFNNSAGSQFAPGTIGFADDRILTVWVDDNSNVDDDAGTDIIGQVFDIEGNAIWSPFQLNQSWFVDSETEPAIAALPDGGFVVAYEDSDWKEKDDFAIRFERYDMYGTRTAIGTIAEGSYDPGEDPTNSDVINAKPSIAVFTNGDFVVNYQNWKGDLDFADGYYGAAGRVVGGGTNAVGAEIDFGWTSYIEDPVPDTTVLSNGDILTAYASDESVYGLKLKILTRDGTTISDIEEAGNEPDDFYHDPHTAALAGGGFVVVWYHGYTDDIGAEVRDNNGAVVKSHFLVAGGGDVQNEPDVVALKDGGFFVVWKDATAGHLLGQRYSSTGAVIGEMTEIAVGAAISEPELGLTDDGRILVTFVRAGDISEVILDPRDTVINGDGSDDKITSRIDGAIVNGHAGNDWLVGQAAADALNGGSGIDSLEGRGGSDVLNGGDGDDKLVGSGSNSAVDGNDVLNGGAGADLMYGGDGHDIYYVDNAGDIVDEATGSGTDKVYAAIGFSLSNSTHVIGEVENLVLTGSANINGSGNNLDNALTGNGGNNVLYAGGGNDTLAGADGKDQLGGGSGNDSLNGGLGADTLTGGLGADRLTGDLGADTFVFTSTSESLHGIGRYDTIVDFRHAQGDRIDLHGIDAKTGVAGNQIFTFIGATAFTHHAGELRTEKQGADIFVYGDTNGDGSADFALRPAQLTTVSGADFVL